METLHQITGIPVAIPNADKKGIRFALTVENGDPIGCFASYKVAEEIASMFLEKVNMLDAMLRNADVWVQVSMAQYANQMQIQRDQMSGNVICTVIPEYGLRYRLSLRDSDVLAVIRSFEQALQDPAIPGATA